jgi:hypothetical protein
MTAHHSEIFPGSFLLLSSNSKFLPGACFRFDTQRESLQSPFQTAPGKGQLLTGKAVFGVAEEWSWFWIMQCRL